MQTLDEIKDTLKRHKEEVIRDYKVKELGIYGSVVRGEQSRRSDIDILVGSLGFSGPFSGGRHQFMKF